VAAPAAETITGITGITGGSDCFVLRGDLLFAATLGCRWWPLVIDRSGRFVC